MPVTSTRQEIATETRDGKTYKITKTISRVTNLVKVPHSIAVRKLLKKYGNASNDSPGPESNSTTIGERVVLKMGIVGEEVDPDLLLKEGLQKLGQQKILCRVCKGDHWTSNGVPDEAQIQAQPQSGGPPGSKKYVPPSMRAGAVPSTGQQFEKEKRDEHPTLRITNLSEEVTEADVRALVDRFGPTARVFCAKYPGTQICKGFAFVSFYSKSDGDKCISVLNGHGYANLILSVEWAKATADKK